MKFKKYDKNSSISYTFGQFPTIELVKSKKSHLLALILHEKLTITPEIENLLDYARKNSIEIIKSSKQIEILGGKENCYLAGVFEKYAENIETGNHIVLVSPSDSGNLGTIIRTMLGRNIKNLAIIKSGKNTDNPLELAKNNTSVDIFSPKVIRASMGSIFNIKVQIFDNFSDYENSFPTNKKYAFCLQTNQYLDTFEHILASNFSLVFGNESTGLPDSIANRCEKLKIAQTNDIDSFNLAISVGMAIYNFTKNNVLEINNERKWLIKT